MSTFVPDLAASDVETRLRTALHALQRAECDALIWFCEIRDRRLYRDLGCSSIWQYAIERLGFSRTKTAYFLRLAKSFHALPALKQSVAAGEITWTQAREVVKVATPRTESTWIERAKTSSRRELERQVASTRARAEARTRVHTQCRLGTEGDAGKGRGVSGSAVEVEGTPGSGACVAGGLDATDDVIEAPVTVTLRFTPEQYARWEAATARLQAETRESDPETLVLGAVETAADITRVNSASRTRHNALQDSSASCGGSADSGTTELQAEEPPLESRPTYGSAQTRAQIFIRRCPDCERAAAITTRGDLRLHETTFERLLCDSRIHMPGGKNTARIPDRLRRAALERDGYRCQAPGCGRTRFVHVHHRAMRENGGGNRLENLITLCSGCHHVFHDLEKRGRLAHVLRRPGHARNGSPSEM